MKNSFIIFSLIILLESCTTIDEIIFSAKKAQGYNKKLDNMLIIVDDNESTPLSNKLGDEIGLALRSVHIPYYIISASFNENNLDAMTNAAIERRLNYVIYLKSIIETSEMVLNFYSWQNNWSVIKSRKHQSIFNITIVDVEYKTVIWKAQVVIDGVFKDHLLEEFRHDFLRTLFDYNLLELLESDLPN
ncbi:MAG: hypothetical protein AMQ74_01711 [Candidatus Methanofastidiosum methylothiophilum]|uniref:Uncharacterized protein n=1 Tax=Candidatus Methanofastidiosum methylothiophilum TaxID=1705564 RepID=A0A150IQ98_9EURY|nr:MAG: hypothetical protein AMQ74_01711 [Candidatus Methanofastidiosum methylthiophilus]